MEYKFLTANQIKRTRYRDAYVFTRIYKNGWENYESGKLEEALFFAKKLEELKGELWDQGIFLNYLIYQKLGQFKNAELYIEQALNLWPNDPNLKLKMASIKYEQKKYEEAIIFSSQTLRSNDKNLKALLILGMSHLTLGNKKKAKDFLSQYLNLNPNDKSVQKSLLTLQRN